jgi:CRP-like cAMP-binding protein
MSRTRFSPLDLARYADLALSSLSRFAPLSEAEREKVISCIAGADIVLADSELLAEGQALRNPKIVLAGWAARVRVLSDGRRQILSFVIPGDLYGLSPRPRSFAVSPTVALTPVAFAPLAGIHEAMTNGDGRGIGLAMMGWSNLASEDALLVSHITRLGRQNAYERVAHLFLELYHRLTAIGLAGDQTFPLPLTQEILSDALGLSVVHTNRTLQHLKRDGFIDYHNGTVRLEDLGRLAALVDFRVPPRPQKN